MTRFKKELIKRGIQTEETLPFLPYNEIEAIIVHSDSCIVATYDNRVGWYYQHYDRQLEVNAQRFEGESWFYVKPIKGYAPIDPTMM